MTSAITPVQWTPVTTDGNVDTTNEAVQTWLNEHPGVDLTNLTKDQLNDLINYLQSLSGQAWAAGSNLGALITNLQQVYNNWDPAAGASKIDALKATTANKQTLVHLLAEATTGSDALDTADTQLTTENQQLQAVSDYLNNPTKVWSGDGSNIQSLDDAKAFLKNLDDLEAQGVDLKSLGLGDLRSQLQAAVDAYDKAVAADPSDAGKAMALSKFRQATSQAKLDYYKSIGLSDTDPKVVAEQNALKGEQLWQYNTTNNWDTTKIPGPKGYTRADLQANFDDLQQQYNMAIAKGDTDAARYIASRMSIVEKAISQLDAGVPQLEVGNDLFLQLKANDIAEKTRLKQQALASGNQSLADQLDLEIESINKLVESTFGEYSGIMSKWADINSQALQAAI